MVEANFADRLNKGLLRAGGILLIACLLVPGIARARAERLPTAGSNALQGRQQPAPTYLLMENVGQYAAGARFLLKQGERRIWLTEDALWLTVPDPVGAAAPAPAGYRRQPTAGARSGTAIRFAFLDANSAAVLEPYGSLPTHVSYLIGNDPARWHRNVPVWSGVRYRDLYPGVDLVIGDGTAGDMPWRLDTRPGADLSAVALRVEGVDTVTAAAGQLHLEMKGRELSLPLPTWSLAGQASLFESQTVPRAADGVLAISPGAQGRLSAEAAASAAEAADAADVIFNTRLGGTGSDTGYGIALDYLGNTYMTGMTRSDDLPGTVGHYDPENNGGTDEPREAFVVKLSAAGDAILYATYLGGAGPDTGWGIAVDGDRAYVVGETDSTDFPGAPKPILDGSDIFVAALNADGSDVGYVSRLGGNGTDIGSGIALDHDVALGGVTAYVTGSSTSASLPLAPNCVAGQEDTNLVVVKLNPAGVPVYTTCLGGSDYDAGYSIAVGSGLAYVTGESWSIDFPGGLSAVEGDILVARFGQNGIKDRGALVGGSAADWGNGIRADGYGSVYVSGTTWSSDFPNAGTWHGPLIDAVVLKLSPTPSTFVVDFATYLGGDGEDYGEEIAVDTVQGAYVVGTTSSTETTFPVTTGTCNAARNGSKDVFVARLHMASSASNKVTYAACLGAANDDWGLGVATDTGGHAFVTGSSASPVDSRMVDAFVAKLKVSSPPLAPTFLPIVTAGADAGLNWTEVDMAATYQLFRSESPYYKPGDWSSLLPIADVTSNSYLDTGALTQVDARYYVAKAVDTTPAASADSNRVGKFTFRLVKGTP